MSTVEEYFAGRPVIVTGGMGFIGSNLVRRLIALGAQVHVVDALIEGSGANRFNLGDVEHRFRLHAVDIGNVAAMTALVGRCDTVFNLAAQINHLRSIHDPVRDLQLNAESHLRFLETCRTHGGRMKIVFTSTRQVYGAQEHLPVSERAVTRPCDINGAHKLTAESYHLLYHRLHGLRATVLRLSNVYGARMPIGHDAAAPLMSRLLGKVLDGEDLEIFGEGAQLRDVLEVEDAVDGLLAAACAPAAEGEIINLGGTEVTTVGEIARAVLDAAGAGTLRSVPFPAAQRNIDIGSIYLDCTKAARLLDWKPRVCLRTGLARTVTFYREHRREYWSSPRHSTISEAATSVSAGT
jgi:UDP-glucose 4-epimerase